MLKAMPVPANASLLSLKVEGLDRIPMIIALEGEKIVFGSDPNIDVTLDVPGIAERHLECIMSDEGYNLHALAKGCSVNQKPLKAKHILAPGDVLELCGLSFLVGEAKLQEEPPSDDTALDASRTQYMQVFAVEEVVTRGRLIGVSGAVKGSVYEFQKDRISVGRDPSNDLAIESDGLSRAHAVVEVGEEDITVMDFGSTNGTFINGNRVTNDTVKPGSIVQFANAGFRYELPGVGESEEEGHKRLSWKSAVLILLVCLVVAGVGIWFNKQRMESVIREKEQALEERARILIEETRGPTNQLKVAREALAKGQYEEAQEIVHHLLEEHPNHPEAVVLLGEIATQGAEALQASIWNKGQLLYEANNFKDAVDTLHQLEPGTSFYEKGLGILQILDQVPDALSLFARADESFAKGRIEEAEQYAQGVLDKVPVHKKANVLLERIAELTSLLKQIEQAESVSRWEEVIAHLQRILEVVPDANYFHNQYASQKLADLTTGQNLKVEQFYVRGAAALAVRDYGEAYRQFLQASQLDPDILKVKIALAETARKRQKILAHFYKLANEMTAKSPARSKILWRKILEMSSEENPYYETAMNQMKVTE